MLTSDLLLIAWWTVIVVLVVARFGYRKRDQDERNGAFLGFGIAVFASGLVIFWLSKETRLYVLNFQLFGVLFGAVCVYCAVAKTTPASDQLFKQNSFVKKYSELFFLSEARLLSSHF